MKVIMLIKDAAIKACLGSTNASPFILAKAKQSNSVLIKPVKPHLGTDKRTFILLLNPCFMKLSTKAHHC